jgi:hypothetical protein
MYIPMLAREVVEGNIRGQQPHINIKVSSHQDLPSRPVHM